MEDLEIGSASEIQQLTHVEQYDIAQLLKIARQTDNNELIGLIIDIINDNMNDYRPEQKEQLILNLAYNTNIDFSNLSQLVKVAVTHYKNPKVCEAISQAIILMSQKPDISYEYFANLYDMIYCFEDHEVFKTVLQNITLKVENPNTDCKCLMDLADIIIYSENPELYKVISKAVILRVQDPYVSLGNIVRLAKTADLLENPEVSKVVSHVIISRAQNPKATSGSLILLAEARTFLKNPRVSEEVSRAIISRAQRVSRVALLETQEDSNNIHINLLHLAQATAFLKNPRASEEVSQAVISRAQNPNASSGSLILLAEAADFLKNSRVSEVVSQSIVSRIQNPSTDYETLFYFADFAVSLEDSVIKLNLLKVIQTHCNSGMELSNFCSDNISGIESEIERSRQVERLSEPIPRPKGPLARFFEEQKLSSSDDYTETTAIQEAHQSSDRIDKTDRFFGKTDVSERVCDESRGLY